MDDTIIEAGNIDKFYGPHQALFGVSLDVRRGEFVALVGPSGCGKTTLLKILAGFEDPSKGSLRIEGKEMEGVPPALRPTRMVFQKLALFPHKTVRENIAFPLQVHRADKATIEEKVTAMMQLMHLRPAYLDRYPSQLSGGEQQRVALARSMVSEPSVLLLDEPLSALDAKLKKSLQAELKNLHRSLGTTFVHVTHDLEEAMVLADRICVMRDGRMQQYGPPADIYYRPANAFVASFIGDTNLIPVSVARDGEGWRAASPLLGEASIKLLAAQAARGIEGGDALMMVRPERVTIGGAGDVAVPARVSERFVKGSSIQYAAEPVAAEGPGLIAEIQGTENLPAEVGDRVEFRFHAEDCFLVKG